MQLLQQLLHTCTYIYKAKKQQEWEHTILHFRSINSRCRFHTQTHVHAKYENPHTNVSDRNIVHCCFSFFFFFFFFSFFQMAVVVANLLIILTVRLFKFKGYPALSFEKHGLYLLLNRTEENRTLLITIHLRPHAGGVREKGMQYMQSIVIIQE